MFGLLLKTKIGNDVGNVSAPTFLRNLDKISDQWNLLKCSGLGVRVEPSRQF